MHLYRLVIDATTKPRFNILDIKPKELVIENVKFKNPTSILRIMNSSSIKELLKNIIIFLPSK